uniref:WAP domain-containing protein n=1 Tax=Sphenodon punctatus TaxID=8508 RepID=A0A8D0H708_SPHPU
MKAGGLLLLAGLLGLGAEEGSLTPPSALDPPDKPGLCPCRKTRPFKMLLPCRDICIHDYECPGRQKCCFTGCSTDCTDPHYVKSLVHSLQSCSSSSPGLLTC